MAKISIIIPSYNVEKFILNCLKSISNQTFKDFEVIIIDDSFIDNTRELTKDYIKNDNRFKLFEINEKGLGISYKRNMGINMSTGEYLLFVDSDDYISANLLENVYQFTLKNNLDICQFDFSKVDESQLIINEQVGKFEKTVIDYESQSFIENLLNYWVSIPNKNYCHTKLYKSDLIKINEIRFKEDIFIGEDLLFNYSLVEHIKLFGYLNETHYFYTQRNNSITKTSDNFNNVIENYIKLYNHLVDVISYDERIRPFIFIKMIMAAMFFMKIKTCGNLNVIEKTFDEYFNSNKILDEFSLKDFEESISYYFTKTKNDRYTYADYLSFIQSIITRNGAIVDRQQIYNKG